MKSFLRVPWKVEGDKRRPDIPEEISFRVEFIHEDDTVTIEIDEPVEKKITELESIIEALIIDSLEGNNV